MLRDREFLLFMLREGKGVMNKKRVVEVQNGYRYRDLITHIEQLTKLYPCLHLTWIGHSVLGKRIPALQLGTGAEQVHINSAVHANEWITTPLLLKFMEELAKAWCDGKPDTLGLLSRISICAVPMVNPDGVDLSQEGWNEDTIDLPLTKWNQGKKDFSHWKANIRGVDLNDQFPAYWDEEVARRGIHAPASQDYAGKHALSEPEAVALARLTIEKNFARVLSMHTQGKELYWNYRDLEPAYSSEFAERMAQAGGYKAVALTGSDAGYKDWFIAKFKRPGFTLEAGEGVNPLPLTQFEQIYEEIEPILLTFIQG